jgi:hypothetical protein
VCQIFTDILEKCTASILKMKEVAGHASCKTAWPHIAEDSILDNHRSRNLRPHVSIIHIRTAISSYLLIMMGPRSSIVVKVLRYKPECRRFDTR